MPDAELRVNIDCNACLLGFAIDAQSDQIKAIIALFGVSKKKNKKYETEKELALTVLPPFQRQYIATDLTRLTWIYVVNNNKSGCFLQSFQQRYPEVRFRRVRP
eukprot:305060_1